VIVKSHHYEKISDILCFAAIIQFSFQASAQWQPSDSGVYGYAQSVLCFIESSGTFAGTNKELLQHPITEIYGKI